MKNNRTITSKVGVSLKLLSVALMGAFGVSGPAYAGLCSDMVAARAGTNPSCSVKRIGSTEVAVPKLVWKKVADSDRILSQALNGGRLALKGKETVLTANRSALALGLDSKEVSAALQTMPSNTPFLVAKYDPVSATLIIDMLKVEKYTESGTQKIALFAASFTPEHGNMWAASRFYISPSDRASGLVPGKNPFAAYDSGDAVFRNISIAGAQVAVGHAMRAIGAPTGLFMSTISRIEPRNESSSSVFKKKTTTIIEGKVIPDWYIVQPIEFLRGGESSTIATICVNDLSLNDCPIYATASAGVMFERFKGGMLDGTEEIFELDRKTHEGLSTFGAVFITVALSYAGAFAYNAVMAGSSAASGASLAGGAAATGGSTGATVATVGTTATTGVGVGASVGSTVGIGTAAGSSATLGLSGTIGSSFGWYSGLTTAQGLALEVGSKLATALVMGGSGGSTYTLKPQSLAGHMSVQKGVGEVSTDQYMSKLRGYTEPKQTGSIAASSGGGQPFKGFSSTVTGTCDLKLSTANCIASGGRVGVALRSDQYMEQPLARFIVDNSVNIVRDGTTTFQGGVRID
jgi:hypothetical protein